MVEEVATAPVVGLLLDYRKCCGCRICEVVCSLKHFGEFNPELSRIRVYDFYHGLIQVPVTCLGCQGVGEEAPCVKACSCGALSWCHDDMRLNVPVINKETCTKCLQCIDACRVKAIRVDPRTGLPIVCDLCGGHPECVKACPTGAIEGITFRTGMEPYYGSDSPEEIAEKMRNHMFYPWKGLEDWRD